MNVVEDVNLLLSREVVNDVLNFIVEKRSEIVLNITVIEDFKENITKDKTVFVFIDVIDQEDY